MKRIKIGFACILINLLCFSLAFAHANQRVCYLLQQFKPVITLTGGFATAQVGRSLFVPATPTDITYYNFDANEMLSTQWMGGISLATELSLDPHWGFQIGLGYYQPSSFSSGNGVLTQEIDPPSINQYPYRYYVSSQQLLAEGKLLGLLKERFHPYISVGLGAVANKAHGYVVYFPPNTGFSPQFANKTTTVFSYSLGAGVDMDFRPNWRFGIGYRFSDLGKASLGSGYIDVTPFAPVLSQKHLYAQEVIAQLSYLVA